jgi:LysR family nitrogen assimilation transcriptional regulator
MDLRQLKYFVAVAENGSFSRAASTTGLPQPSLSRHIKQLEEELRAPLFYRNGRGATLTPAGELLIAFAVPMLEKSVRVERDIMALSGSVRGAVTIGILPTLAPRLLTPLLKILREQHPELRLRVQVGMSGTVVDWLQSGEVDIGTIYQPHHRNVFLAETLLVEDLFLVRRTGSSLPVVANAEDLSRLPLVIPGPQHGLRQLVEEAMAKRDLGLQVVYEVDSINAIKGILQSEDLATLLPKAAVESEVRQGRLEISSVPDLDIKRTLALATARNSTVDTARRAVIRTIRSVAALVAPEAGWSADPYPTAR